MRVAGLYILLLISSASFAQQKISLYNLSNSSAASALNPSRIPQSKWHLGLPGFSNVNLSYSNSAFHMNDLIKVINDSMQINYNSALGAMSKHNFIGVNAQIELIQFGIKIKKRNYVSFTASVKNTVNFRFDKEPIELVIVGNGPFINANKKINFETNTSSYVEYALGFSRSYAKNKVRFGGKLKILSGIANLNTKKKDIYIKTNNENYGIEVTSDIDYRTSGVEGNSISPFGPNLGAAIDFGFFYQWKKNISFSGSLLDVGAIRWKGNVKNYRSENPGGKQVYEGMPFSEFFDEGKSYKEAAQELFDSLKSEFALVENGNAYTSSIPTQLYLNLEYTFRKNTKLGITAYSHFFKTDLFLELVYP